MTVVERKCVVCGQGSTREDWQSKDNPACDHHKPEEIKAALAAKTPAKPTPPATASTAPAQPNGGAKTG